MMPETLVALKRSIAKWEKLTKVKTQRGVELGPRNCPLCVRFFAHKCRGCPVKERSGLKGCVGTPYEQAEYALYRHTEVDEATGLTVTVIPKLSYFQRCAAEEAAFLKSLLPEDEA